MVVFDQYLHFYMVMLLMDYLCGAGARSTTIINQDVNGCLSGSDEPNMPSDNDFYYGY